MGKMTKAQREMFDACVERDALWTTASGCENDEMLAGWVDRGWAQRAESPSGLHSLVSYRITPAGRAALSQGGGE